MAGNSKSYILITFDLENALIDPKINSARLGSIPYHTAKYRSSTYFLG